MEFQFSVAGMPVDFRHDQMTGRAELRAAGQVYPLQTPGQLSTQIELGLHKTWRQTIADHVVTIEKVRPLFLPWARPNTYRVSVDGQLITEQRGR